MKTMKEQPQARPRKKAAPRSRGIPNSAATDALKAKIPGWGSDLLPKNRPGVPKEKAPPATSGARRRQPEAQVPQVKIHVSIERAGITPVFGTACPPSGLSGWIRDIAYRLGEARLSRWMLLLLADRINVIENLGVDLISGRLPHPIREMGLGAERKRSGSIAKLGASAGVVASVVGIAGFALARRNSRSQKAA